MPATKPIKPRRLAKGEARQFVKCLKCGCAAYYDYVPYGLGNPIRILECCQISINYHNSTKGKDWDTLTEAEAMKCPPFAKTATINF